MIRKLIKDESGFSLPEVIVAMLIITIAIIPMIGMFGSGLKAASTGSDLDKARSLANKQLEQAKNLPYADARDKFPGTDNAIGASGYVEVLNQEDPDTEYSRFETDVVKEYVHLAATDSPTTMEFEPTGTSTDSGMVRITVTVRWEDKDYRTAGVVSQ